MCLWFQRDLMVGILQSFDIQISASNYEGGELFIPSHISPFLIFKKYFFSDFVEVLSIKSMSIKFFNYQIGKSGVH